MNHDHLQTLRRSHPAWRLLAADSAPLVAGFLHHCFIEPNIRVLPEQDLAARLDDYLYHLRETLGENAYPRSAMDYLPDWADDTRGWLRRYYPVDSDEAHYDLTPGSEQAIQWLAGLEQRQFVGAESRLKLIFGLGYGLDRLADVPWLERCEVWYWGDIDTHGVGILDRLRAVRTTATPAIRCISRRMSGRCSTTCGRTGWANASVSSRSESAMDSWSEP
jgi:hypothetical protein